MRKLEPDEVVQIMSQDHLRNTAHAIGKEATDVSAEELIRHWLDHHPMNIIGFDVEAMDYHIVRPVDRTEDGLALFV